MEEDGTAQEEDALHVFLLMGKEYRISRSIRAQWFFEQFNKTLSDPKSHDELIASNEELEVLSVISNNQDKHGPYKLVPSTQITFIGRRYRYVFCFDISPSLATVDIQSGTVITDEAFEKFKNCLNGLVAPFSVPGNTIVLRPELYITVLAYTSNLDPEVPQILIQGCLVTEENINFVLESVHRQLMELEDFLAKTTSTLYCDICSSDEENKTESNQSGLAHDSVTLMSPEAGPISILRNTLLALQLLPGNASAGAVVITDGVFALPDAITVDSLLAQLRASTVCCSFIKVGSGFHAHCSLGYVPHCDMMQFIAMASSGAYLAKAPSVSKDGKRVDEEEDFSMNLYHKALLCWNFQRDFDLSKIDSWMVHIHNENSSFWKEFEEINKAVQLWGQTVFSEPSYFNPFGSCDCLELSEEDLAWALQGKKSMSYALSEWEKNAMQRSMRIRHLETKLHTSITSVLNVRLREGYSIQDVSIAKGGKQLQVKLTIPWKHNVQIEYLALSVWPLSTSSCVTHVEVTIEAPYEFLHDVMHSTKPFPSPYRTLVVKRFRQSMKSLKSTDQMLVHLQSFSSNSIYYTIPESAKKGVPLFYLPPSSNNPVLSLQLERENSKSQESQFAVFWKPVLSLDTTGWQKWMHSHRIGLVLEHDVPLPKNLHLPKENDRSSAIQCRVALSSLNSLLRKWSSFVLLENHSYIKFIASENPDGAPSSFCIVRVTARGPCIVIKVAFLGGTAGHIRHQIVSDLKIKLADITAPLGVINKPQKAQAKGKSLQRDVQLSKQRTVVEKPCAIMYEKSLDGILIRYDRVPEDLFSAYPERPSYSMYSSLTGNYAYKTNDNHMKVLCQYLHHHRWIWTMQDERSPALSAEKVARVLSTLTKLRLQEGYNFVNNSAGIITMAKELKMKDHTQDSDQPYSCVIQYVLFPPYLQSCESERSEESVLDWASLGKAGRKFNMVTEVWTEPQFGCLTDLKTELKYMEGLQYDQVPDAIYQADVKHVSALLTYDHLLSMCDDKTVTTPQRSCKASHETSLLFKSNWIVEQSPFPFDIIDLLSKTRQVEMVFSSLIETSSPASDDLDDLPNENLFKLLIENMERLNDREVVLSDDDWNRFTQHILIRPRDGEPLPFPEELCQRKDSSDSTQNDKEKKSKNRSTSSMKWRCFIRAVTAFGGGRLILTFLPASFKYVRLMGRHQRSRSSSVESSPRSPHGTSEVEPEGATDEISPHGACGLLKLNNLLVSQGSLEDQSLTPTPTAEKDESPFFYSQKTSNSLVSNEESKLSINSDDEKKSVTFQENSTPIKERKEPVFHDRGFGKDSDSFSWDIPIYCYDCPMSALVTIPAAESDTEGTSEEKREDIFQDFTQFAAHVFVDPFSLDEVPRSLEGRTKGRFGPSKDLLLHCSAVHDLFFRSFVTSTFSSLQHGQQVSMRDVDSAVEACEENFLEVDITEFIHTLCGHYIKSNKSKEAFFETTINEDLLSVPIWLSSESSEERVRDLKESLVGQCESVDGLHKSITAKFFSIMGRYFKAVPPSREYFFYCPQQSEGPRKSALESFSEFETFEADQAAEDDAMDRDSDVDSDASDDGDIFLDDGTVQQDEIEDMSDFESQASDIEFEGDADVGQEVKSPLFLQLTCSLKDTRSHGQPMTPVAINTLPVCLGEIIRKFEDHDECLDPFSPSVRITLDLICLTLPAEHDYSVLKSSARHSFARSNSFSSTSSPISASPSDKRSGLFDFRRQDSKATSHDMERIESLDPLHGLINSQRQAVNNTREAIRWLLQDEIVSELRHIGPVDNSMLEKVEQHVQQSEDHPSCISRRVHQQFVYGAEQSLEVFVKEFERISLPEYVLKNVDKYYYLTSFSEKQVAALSPLTQGENGGYLDKQQEEEATTPNPDTDGENYNQKSLPLLEVQATPESHTSANDRLSTVYIEKQATTTQHEESVEDNLRENGMITPPSRPPHLGQLGKQRSEEEEEPGNIAASTPLRDDASFASSAGSTPIGKLIIPGEDVGAADSSNAEAEEDESCPLGPCTPRHDELSVSSSESCLKFWLVMKILDSEVNIVFHQRESHDPKSFCATRANGLVEMVINALHEKCRIVNQRMLLHELFETKLCNSMLFPESDVDIWKHEDMQISVSPLGVHMTKGDSKGRVSSKFVPVQFLFQPGHFGCDSKWYTHLPVHQRLLETSGRTGVSRGLKVIKSALETFDVRNRKNMFVYKDSAGSIFYFRLFESLCSSNQVRSDPRSSGDDDDDYLSMVSVTSLAGSRTSSQLSLSSFVNRGPGDVDEDVAEAKSKKLPTAQEQDTTSIHSAQPIIDKSIALHVYGVDDPGPEITVELVDLLQNRINDAMLEVLSVLLARNPNCKLTYADVRFIQPQNEPPKTTLTLLIPKMDVNFLCPLVFYLRQNLLQLLHFPRYMDSDPSHHFKALSGSKLDATGSASGESRKLEPEIYLYNRPHSSGGKGVACISVSVLNWRGGYIYIPCGKRVCVYAGEIDVFEYLTEVSLCPDELHLADDDIKVQFAIWERGDIGLDQLSEQLKLTLRHALCDLLTEYYLLAAPLSKVPKLYRNSSNTRLRSSSAPTSPLPIPPKVPTHLESPPEKPATPSKRQLNFGSQSSFRNKSPSVSGHRQTPSDGSTPSSGSTEATRRSPQNPFLSQRQSVSSSNAVSRQSTVEDEVFQSNSTSPAADVIEVSAKENKANSHGVTESTDDLPAEEVVGRGQATLESKDKLGMKNAPEKLDNSSDIEPTFESFTAAEIQESQEFTSQPGTPVTENVAFLSKKEEQLSEKLNKPSSISSASSISGSKSLNFSGMESSSVGGQLSDVQGTWQDVEAVRRKEREKKKRRIQYENGERGELHPSLQGLCQKMFSFFRELEVPSVYCIEGKLLNNFASDAFLAELCNLISSVCPDMKPRVYREAPVDSADGNEADHSQEFRCLHYYPARQPLKVQDMEESTTDKSGKPFTTLPKSSQFFVVVGRNVDQWRASLGLEEDLSQDDALGRPRIRTGLQRFKPLDPNALVPGRNLAESVSLSSLSLGGVPRQKFLLVTVMDKEVKAFTYNWASDINTTFDKQLHRLINWSNVRCHLTYCLLSQKMGLYHHTLFTDINKGKESKDMNPFCLSANDKDMSLLISHPGPPAPDRAVPRSMPPSPSILVFDKVLRDVTPPRPLYRTPYSHNRDLVKRHGYQFQEIRSVQIKKAILEKNLDELYVMWLRRPPHVQISEDKIETLKRSSRLIHYCAAPLLFHPDWRKLRSSYAPENSTVTPEETSSEDKKQETKERKTSKAQKTIDETKKEETAEAEKKPRTEEAWHKELRSAYLQLYVQYMQSLRFIVVQSRPQSPKQSRRHLGRGAVNTKPKRESSPADVKKQSSTKDIKGSSPKTLQRYLQKTSPGGIMLMELVFQGCFFIVRLYALGCSQIPSGKSASVQICRMFVEDCNRHREYIHLLSFNYDFHLCKAQFYLNGSQIIFNKGYGVTHMLKGLLQEYVNSPVFARNRLGYGEISVPLHPGITPQIVFNYLVKKASFYEFHTLPEQTTNASSSETNRVLTHILREYGDYDVSFVLSLKETKEEGVVTMEYIVLMTSRRELFPKLTLDLRLSKKSPSSGSLSTMSSGNRTVDLPENGETEQEIASRVRFNLPMGSSQGIPNLPSPGEFHRSASSPHSLYALGHEGGSQIFNVPSSRSDEKIGDHHRDVLPPFAPIPEHYEEELPENVALRETKLLKEASLRGRDHLVHIICRAQTHCNRDLLWHRLLVGETEDEERDGGKKSRRKSVMRKSSSETSLKQSWAKTLDSLNPGADQVSPSRLTFEDFQQLLSVVGVKSLREEDPQLISLLSMRATWFLSLFPVIRAKFPEEHRLFTDENSSVHCLAVLNRDCPDMFVLLYVDKNNDSADIYVVFREDLSDDKEISYRSRLLRKEVRSHVYGVINAMCFHMWTGLLPV